MTDPPPKKIGSLRDRIAAFENKGPAPVPSPPQPRPKPAGGVSWKPRAASPPPPAEENVEKKTGGMSAADAKQSISKGGSLKDRMAALQGLNTFGGAAPVTPPPRPSSEKPKWKPPPVVSPPVEEDELAESKLNETPTSPTEDVNESVGERDASQTEPAVEEPVETSAEEEERQRRAALAARMARLGGARVGMGPPVFAKKPDIKKTETPKSDEPKSSETEDVLSPPKIQSPPVETASPPVQESSGEYFADVNTSTASLLSADSVDTTGSTPRSPAMPVPAVPRRAAPPRRKTPKSPAPPISDAPLTASPAAGTPQETSDEKSKELQEDVRKSKEDEVSLGLAPEPLSGDSRHLDKVEQGEPVEPVTAEAPTEESQHIGAVHDDVHDTSTSEKAHSDDNDVGKLPAIEASAVDDDTRALFYTEEAEQSSEPEVEEEHDDTPAAPENVHSAAIQEPATGNEEEEEDTLVAPEPEEEDEAARRKRIADRLRQQGGFNPFAAPPIRKASVSPTELTSQTTTADEPDVPSPLPPRRQSTRQGSTDSYSALSSAGSGRRTSVQSITSPVAEAVVPPVSFSPKPTEPESIQDGNIVAEQEELEEKPDDPDSMLSENAYALSHTLHAEPESEVEDANEVYREMSPDSYHEPLRHDQELSRDEDEYVESTIEQAQREEDIHVPAPAAEPAPPPPPRRVSLPPPKRASLPPPPRAIPAIPQEPSASSPIISPVSAKSAYSPVEPQHIGGGNAVEESLPASQHQPAPAQTQPRLHVDVGQTEAEGSVEASAIPSHELPYVPPRRLSTEIPRRALPPPPTVLPPTVEVETNAEGDDVQELAAESSDYSEEDEAPLAPPEEEELSRDPEPETVELPVVAVTSEHEVLDDSDGDPIDPAFHSPQKTTPAMHFPPALSPASPEFPPTREAAASASTQPAEISQVQSTEEDDAQARRQTLAERMAKLGGIKFGAPPPVGRRPPPPPELDHVEEESSKEEQSEHDDHTEPGANEEAEEDEAARRQRIAARLAGMGGMRFGMLPSAAPVSPGVPAPPSVEPTEDEDEEIPPPPPPRASAGPPPRHASVNPPSRDQAHEESEPESESPSDGVQVEAEESELEELTHLDADDAQPPPIPSREVRRTSIPQPIRSSSIPRPPVPTARPPVPPTVSRPPLPPMHSHGDFVMVDEADATEEPPPLPPPRSVSLKKGPPKRGVPPPPPPPADLSASVTSQWESTVDFGGETDLSLSGQWSEDSTQYPQPPTRETSEPSAGHAAPSGSTTLSSDELIAQWGRVGVQIHEIATTLYEKSRKSLIGDRSYIGFIDAVLNQVPNASKPSPPYNSFGYLIYEQSGASVLRHTTDIMPGDIITVHDAKLKGHKGLQIYNQTVGSGEPVFAIIGDFEVKKSKVKAFQANQHVGHDSVESVSYRLEDLKSGSVKIFRVLEA